MKVVFGLQLIGLVGLLFLALPRDKEYRNLLASIGRLDYETQYNPTSPISPAAIRDLKAASEEYRNRKSREFDYLLLVIVVHLGITALTPIRANLIQKK
jgi:hypothetical protein